MNSIGLEHSCWLAWCIAHRHITDKDWSGNEGAWSRFNWHGASLGAAPQYNVLPSCTLVCVCVCVCVCLLLLKSVGGDVAPPVSVSSILTAEIFIAFFWSITVWHCGRYSKRLFLNLQNNLWPRDTNNWWRHNTCPSLHKQILWYSAFWSQREKDLWFNTFH